MVMMETKTKIIKTNKTMILHTKEFIFLCKEKSGSMTKYFSTLWEHTAVQYANNRAAKMNRGQQNGCRTECSTSPINTA